MDKEYDFLIYQRGSETKELKLPNDMNCSEFKVICIRMAHAIGYHENSVRETFGNIADINKSKDTNQIKLLFD